MGMFDYVRYSAPCVGCGKEIKRNWQTKDGECLLDVIDIDPQRIRHWYTTCDNCGQWNEKRIKATAWEVEDQPPPVTSPLPAPAEEKGKT